MPFDAALAQRLSDSAVNILRVTEAHELLPRVATSPDHFECQSCAKQVVEKPFALAL